jgi:hypothetical protein
MDDVEDFDINSKIEEGLYYVETKRNFQLRGNGFYYSSSFQFCLD